MRINARLDDEHAGKLSYLMKATESSVSEVVKRAIDLYYSELQSQQVKPVNIWKRSGFIGCCEGPDEISARYKEAFREIAAAKHDHF
ncbi:MAG: ribbon-helix-helix protein, CopG family [Gammaproteobacteria bacterium]